MHLTGNVFIPLAKSFLIPLGLTAVASVTDVAIHEKMFRSGNAALIISKEEINDVMNIVKFLEECGLLIKGISKTSINEAKEQKGGFLGMLLGTLGANFLENLLTVKVSIRIIRAGENF